MSILNDYTETEGAIAVVEAVVNSWISKGYPAATLTECFLTAFVDISTDEDGPEATADFLRRMADAVERGETGEVLTTRNAN